MNETKTFQNAEFGEIRTLTIDGEPWFVGKDVAAALGYTNPQKALRDHVDGEDKTVNESFTVHGTQGILINESGLYSLILSSKLPSAKAFKRWVTSEVLPSIRKTGAYAVPQTLPHPYPPKATSVGEVAQLLKVLRATMKDNNQPPEMVALMVKTVCDQFKINLPAAFVRHEPFQQFTIFGILELNP